MTHRALLSGKYKHFIANDIDARLPKFFLDCAYGKYTTKNHTEWISREDFYKNINDAYVLLIWSFGNNGKDYCYGKDIEDYKKAFHYACFFNDFSLIKEYGIVLQTNDNPDIYTRYLDYSRQIGNSKPNLLETFGRLFNIEKLQSLQSLQSLQRLQSLQSLQSFGTDYQNVPIPKNALIYCDIPYVGTNCGKYGGFNHDRFYEWARKQENIYISEYSMPDDFIPIAHIYKTILSDAKGNCNKADERLFVNQKTYEKLSDEKKLEISFNFSQQITIFDFMKGSD